MMNRVLAGQDFRSFNWQQEHLVDVLNVEDAFWGLNEDHFFGGLTKPSNAFFCDELQAVLNPGNVSESQFEFDPCYSIQRTISCPTAVEQENTASLGSGAAVGTGGPRKRTAESLKGGADAKMEKKKMKICDEEESKLSEQNSNSNCKSTTTAADSSRRCPAASKSDSNSKGGDAPKTDYIHVRARRGQATDSHSLAERVRREKISERMKYLQDLVPGCNKITGKAAMLDEIINYVQSLQRQVELLSMKLAALTPRFDHDMESNLPKEIYQPIHPVTEVNNSGLHYNLAQINQIPHTFIESQFYDMQTNFIFPQSFTGEGFMGAGNVKIEMP